MSVTAVNTVFFIYFSRAFKLQAIDMVYIDYKVSYSIISDSCTFVFLHTYIFTFKKLSVYEQLNCLAF